MTEQMSLDEAMRRAVDRIPAGALTQPAPDGPVAHTGPRAGAGAPGGAHPAQQAPALPRCAYCPRPKQSVEGFVTCGSLECIVRLQQDLEKQGEAEGA